MTRVRYKMYGEDVRAECDLTDKQARKLYDTLKIEGACLWAELIGEDDHNYMDVLEAFDHPQNAKVCEAFESLGFKIHYKNFSKKY